MQTRWRPFTLRENIYGTAYPSPAQKLVDMTALNGGLNLWELDYKLDLNQSPDLLNVFWQDGSLSSRPGQAYVYDPATDTENNYGDSYACYERPWQDHLIAQKGTTIYKINPETGEHVSIYEGTLTPAAGGTFFVFGDKLYYMNGHEYIVIDNTLTAKDVDPYVPIVIVNRQPSGIGGSALEDENRLSPKKRIRFTTDGTAVEYVLPEGFTPLDPVAVKAVLTSPSEVTYVEKQTYASYAELPETGESDIAYYATAEAKYYKWEGGAYAEREAPDSAKTFTVDREEGKITFSTAPAAALTQSPSNLEVTISKTDENTLNSILNCSCVTVYGGDKQLAVVCGGTPAQPNAYFWSGTTTDTGLDPTYFPFDYYNYAGANAAESIIGFGKQQSMLVIFKERSIGKSYFATVIIDGEEHLKLPYTPVNDSVGCNLEGSIRLVQNNLIFANTYAGVYVLLDSTAYGENTVKRLSRNVNGDELIKKGLLHDLRQVAATGVTSFDDQQRYWLTANGHAYLWDYTISSFTKHENNLSWFLFDNVNPVDWFKTEDENFYIAAGGSVVKFVPEFNDFGSPIVRRYKFATLNFGTYEVLKDVLKVVFAVRSDTDSALTVTYQTDYGAREDLTPIRALTYRLVPRNLTFRCLRPVPFAYTAVRTPRCFHVRHFSLVMTNDIINTDMSIIQVQILYRYSMKER